MFKATENIIFHKIKLGHIFIISSATMNNHFKKEVSVASFHPLWTGPSVQKIHGYSINYWNFKSTTKKKKQQKGNLT